MRMLRVTTVAILSLATMAGAMGCATGIGTGEGEDDVVEVGGNAGVGGDVATGGTGGTGGNPTGMPVTGGVGGTGGNPTGMPGTGGMGGDPGPTCDPPQHLCGGICTGNTPATGCYQSVSCTPCPTVTNGSATCDANGQCAAMCNSPYVANGNQCVCPSQCCTNADCSGNATCQNGTCVQQSTCDEGLCIFQCGLQSMFGVCVNDMCVCF